MSNFRLLKRTRQVTEYSCGASALQSVLAYWGRDVDERELMALMGTTEEEGTYPEKIVHAARALGFEAEARENLTLDEVEAFTAQGHPVIALAQVWRTGSAGREAHEEWDAGHYVCVLGVDRDYVYTQDPYIRMGKAFVPRKTFEAHWHQVMGGARTNNPKLIHLGIFVRGRQPARTSLADEVRLAAHDLARFGSLNLIVTRFRSLVFPLDLLEQVTPLLESDSVRANAFIFLRKDADGLSSGLEGSGLDDDAEMTDFNALVTAVASCMLEGADRPTMAARAESAARDAALGDFGLSAETLRAVADQIPPGESVLIVFFENLWERRFKDIARRFDGEVIHQRMITPQALLEAAEQLAATA